MLLTNSVPGKLVCMKLATSASLCGLLTIAVKKKKKKEKKKNYESVKKEAEQMDTKEGGSASVNNVQKSKRIQLNQLLYQSLYDNNMPAALKVLEHDFNTT